MSDTARLALPLIAPSQAQKHVTHNEALQALDALIALAILDRDLATPPGSPAEGDIYLVAASGTGDWTGRDGSLAVWENGAWSFLSPVSGTIAYVSDEATHIAYDGSTWADLGNRIALQALSVLGINATADTTNRLAVSAPAALFDAETDNMQVKVNKVAAGDTASVLFQTGFSGRAEFGLTGDDDWHVKVSADGSTWNDVLVADAASGTLDLTNGLSTPLILATYTVAGLPSAAASTGAMAYCSDETGGAVPVFSDGANWRRVTDRAIAS